ncbi:MAG: IS630 family transposase [Candidatus Aenigmatarchaeota archaeon]
MIKYLSSEELIKAIKVEEKRVRVLQRLYFIKFLYEGMTVEQASQKIGVTKAVGYQWLNRWNEKGYEGLIPKFGGGKPSKLSKDQMAELKNMLKSRELWALNEVMSLILEKFGVVYSERQVRRILKKLGMRHAKPYPIDYRRPKDADKILKKTIRGGP